MSGSVLIIDAEEDFVSELAQGLKDHGLETTATSDGKAGLDLAHINIPSAIVLCAELPRMSGYSICAKLKKDSTLKSVPLVITSAEATQETFEHHKKLKTRADEYLRKPFSADDLILVLENYLPSNGGGRTEEMIATDSAEGSDGEIIGISDAIEMEEAELEDFQSIDDSQVHNAVLANISDDEVLSAVGAGGAAMAQAKALVEEVAQLKERLAEEEESRRRAERERDVAVANEKAVAAQVQAMSSSQIPSSSIPGSTRELLSVKKELNAKDREILELHERITQKDKELLAEKDRQMELEDQLVQIQDEREAIERAKVESDGRTAAAEARAAELARSSEEKLNELHGTIRELTERQAATESELGRARADVQRLNREVSDKAAALNELEETHIDTTEALEASQAEASALRDQMDKLKRTLADAEARADDLGKTARGQSEEIGQLRSELTEAEERASRAYQKIRDDEETKAKAKKALEIAIALLQESGYTPDLAGTESEETFSSLDAVEEIA
ncbi:MAG: response regulator [Deltaproteobacteria bacterium]|nr:response regulator [Deltaproteobacteria bacterium]